MASKKPKKACPTAKPHQQHVWSGEVLKFFCPGVKSAEHVHVWDAASGPIMREREIDAPGLMEVVSEPWNGPIECPCGLAAWLTNGVKKRLVKTEVRFPNADVMERTLALKSKLDRGDELSEEDKAEFEAIAAALVEAFKPLVEAFQKMAEQVIEFLATFLDRLDPETVRELHRLAQTYGEHTDSPPETIELRDVVTGEVIAEHIIGHDPISATQHAATEIVEDSLQPLLAPDSTDPIEAARRAVAEPFKEPFHLSMADGEMVGQTSMFEDSPLAQAARRAAQDSLLGDTLRRYRSS